MSADVLEVRGLGYRYPAAPSPTLREVSLRVPCGTVLALVGRSGCGKTTLLNLLAGYLKPTSGTCALDGAGIEAPGPSLIPMPQTSAIFPWLRVVDNVLLSRRLCSGNSVASDDHARAVELLREVGLPPTIASQFPRTLSEGMKKRVELARALLQPPRVLLADEPFSTLDADTRETLQRLLADVSRRHALTVVFSTHDLDEAVFLADTIAVFSPKPPSTVVSTIENPLKGELAAHRHRPAEFYPLVDSIRQAMGVQG